MAQEFNSIKDIIKDFIDELQTREMQKEKIFLFGAYTKRHNSENSDIEKANYLEVHQKIIFFRK